MPYYGHKEISENLGKSRFSPACTVSLLIPLFWFHTLVTSLGELPTIGTAFSAAISKLLLVAFTAAAKYAECGSQLWEAICEFAPLSN